MNAQHDASQSKWRLRGVGEEGSDYLPVHVSYSVVLLPVSMKKTGRDRDKLSMLESAEKNKSRLGPYFTLSSNCLLLIIATKLSIINQKAEETSLASAISVKLSYARESAYDAAPE